MTVLNFNAGPAAMPAAVLGRIREELPDVAGTGISILETSHRSATFADIAARAEADFRALLGVPDGYSVLFMQGGASAQFALTVQNLDTHGVVGYADTGHWSRKAINAGKVLTRTAVVCELESSPGGLRIPRMDSWAVPEPASFVHICDNETIAGVAYAEPPTTGVFATSAANNARTPVVADFSSSILSGPVDVARYDAIYAGAQKNIGPAGLTLVILSPEMLARSKEKSSSMAPVFSYSTVADSGSMLNTPPTFAWYAAGLVFQWLEAQGGLTVIGERNTRRAKALYSLIDAETCFANDIHPDNRSCMNVTFRLSDDTTTSRFLEQAAQAGMIGLRGHKALGGVRASLYNAVPDEHAVALMDFMREFSRTGRG